MWQAWEKWWQQSALHNISDYIPRETSEPAQRALRIQHPYYSVLKFKYNFSPTLPLIYILICEETERALHATTNNYSLAGMYSSELRLNRQSRHTGTRKHSLRQATVKRQENSITDLFVILAHNITTLHLQCIHFTSTRHPRSLYTAEWLRHGIQTVVKKANSTTQCLACNTGQLVACNGHTMTTASIHSEKNRMLTDCSTIIRVHMVEWNSYRI